MTSHALTRPYPGATVSWPHPDPEPARLRTLPRIFVVDDDQIFCRRIEKLAGQANIAVTCFHPDEDFTRLPSDGDYDAAIIDYDLGHLRGTQLSSLYAETPVVLVSASASLATLEREPWPRAVRAFVRKRDGLSLILDEALRLSWEGGLGLG